MAGKRIAHQDSIKVIAKTPATLPPASRGFYQVEEDVLYVPVYPAGSFFSYLDSTPVLLDIDRMGRLVFIQVLAPRRGWLVRPNLKAPLGAVEADIRFRDFRARLPRPTISTNKTGSVVHIRFASSRKFSHFRVADHLIFDITPNDILAGIWITAVEDDRAASNMASWRKDIKRSYGKLTYDSRLSRYESKR